MIDWHKIGNEFPGIFMQFIKSEVFHMPNLIFQCYSYLRLEEVKELLT